MLSTWKLWAAGAGLAAVLAGAAGLYAKGRADGRAAVTAQLAADRVQILKDGKDITDAVLGADDDRLCELLGGCELPDGASGH